MSHEYYMQLALEEAVKGRSFTSPNPMVGAILVKDDRIIGKGYHHAYGQAHAEVEAIASATESVEGATMYVTLEPCSHYGKTPPCSLALIQAKLKQVVVSTTDPNPLVAGKGIQMLQSAGIDVITGVLEEEGKELNRIFFHFIQKRRPYVLLKSAMSLDGKIATRTGSSQWISSVESRAHAHTLRANYRSILVGVNTVIADNPSLTTRLSTQVRQPIRCILDSTGRIPLDCIVLNDAYVKNTWVMTTERMSEDVESQIKDKGATVIRCLSDQGQVDLNDCISKLSFAGIDSLLIEGGSDVAFGALKANIVDEVIFYLAPKILGGKEAFTSIGGQGVATVNEAIELKKMKTEWIGNDLVISALVKKGDN
ncbi:MAG TPA: bifunctional diaminohydroxyphosphoribosylaminopyrimidine deaminase/5-amino-6-(5-phosphoribosylamino)uracil reductase RibD [Erysipelotrichaceae bacterium]|nr:bifunctional diaminohydroxyphosphoribosylaminopyrimidine deaminase/5-amino-6-(5-phosphoribosylamino)uracil reductase RibD [Erysipelotrichaceae bacterium]